MLGYRQPMSSLPSIFFFFFFAFFFHFAVFNVLADEDFNYNSDSNFNFNFNANYDSDSDSDSDSANTVKLELLHRHHHEVSEKLFGVEKPETLIDRFRDLQNQDRKRYSLISKTLLIRNKLGGSYRQNESESEIKRRVDLQSMVDVELKMHSGADFGSGTYFVHLQVGTPPQKFMLMADTGSDLTWIKCRYRRCKGNCSANHKNHHNNMARAVFPKSFHANQSSTFKPITCSSDFCRIECMKLFSLAQCPLPTAPCRYDYRYLSGFSAVGIFANETVTVGLANGKQEELNDTLIGCTEFLTEDPLFRGSDGVLGLGNGKHSFTDRVGRFSGGGFSYCLVDHYSAKNLVNHFTFGTPKALTESSNLNMTYTELFIGGLLKDFYGVNMTGISVDGKMLNITPEAWDINIGGGTILDSGTSLLHLTTPVFDAVYEALFPTFSKFPLIDLESFDLCFNDTNFKLEMVPIIKFHFGDGAVLQPPQKSYVVAVAHSVSCVAFQALEFPSTNILGNVVQQNYLWHFDFHRRRVGFAPSSCT